MRIHLAQIPAEGLRQSVTLPLAGMQRLTETIGAQTGAVSAELLLKNRDGSVEITGTLRAHIAPPCQRCLDAVPLDFDEPVRVALVPEREYDAAPEDISLGTADLEVSFYHGEELDLGHLLEDELLLLIPEPVAEEDEEGCCVVCGRHVDDVLPAEEVDETHPFAQLKQLLHTD